MGTAERILGVSRRDLGRFEKIAGISAEAKEEARRAGLDDSQTALLAIAAVPAGQQLAKVRELKQEYADGRRKPSVPAKSKKSAGSSAAAATKKKRGHTKEGPDDADHADAEGSSTDSADDVEDDAEDAEAEGSSADSTEGVEDDADDPKAGADSTSIVPEDGGLGIPPILRRTDEKQIKARLQKIYDDHLAPEWPSIPLVLQCWFVTELLGIQILTISKENRPQ